MEKLLQKYAELAVKSGVNIQKGQYLVINCPVSAHDFARRCAKIAYQQGAGQVEVRYVDADLNKLDYEFVETDELKKVANWKIIRQEESIEKKCAFLHIVSEKPGLLKSIDSNKLQTVQIELYKAMDRFQYYTKNNHGQWSIIAVPNSVWAKQLFPNDDEELAISKLWDAIFKAVRVNTEEDAITLWNNHNKEMLARVEKMNAYHFKSLHFKNDLGTDLVVELNRNHIWHGGSDLTQGHVLFNPNMPTEEIFSMPKRNGVNGRVYSTKPLNYQGKLIEDFYIDFKDGKAVAWDAKKEKEALSNLINLDEGSAYLGEVALISHDSPISNMNILFMNTLFDENASCHLALGSAYPTNMVDGEKMSKEELVKNDCNVSMTHVDFMFGSSCMEVTGYSENGESVILLKKGNFVM